MTPFQQLFTTYVGTSFSKQLAFADVIGKRNWNVNLDEGLIRFGSDQSYTIQLLGSQSSGDNSWMWAWANEAMNLPTTLTKASLAMREVGQKEGIDELSQPTFASEFADGHTLSMIASGMNRESCYYRGPYGGGAAFFLIMNPPQIVSAPAETARVLRVIPQVISTWSLEHGLMAESFLRSQNFDWERNGNEAIATRDGDRVQINFDDQGRISGLSGKLEGKAPRKPWWKFW